MREKSPKHPVLYTQDLNIYIKKKKKLSETKSEVTTLKKINQWWYKNISYLVNKGFNVKYVPTESKLNF